MAGVILNLKSGVRILLQMKTRSGLKRKFQTMKADSNTGLALPNNNKTTFKFWLFDRPVSARLC